MIRLTYGWFDAGVTGGSKDDHIAALGLTKRVDLMASGTVNPGQEAEDAVHVDVQVGLAADEESVAIVKVGVHARPLHLVRQDQRANRDVDQRPR